MCAILMEQVYVKSKVSVGEGERQVWLLGRCWGGVGVGMREEMEVKTVTLC